MAPTVLITGADEGLGFALARRFLDGGFTVLAGRYNRSLAALPGLAAARSGLHIVDLDVADGASVAAAHACVAGLVSSLDILINNAGIHPPASNNALPLVDFAVMERTLAVNAIGPLRVVQRFLPLVLAGEKKLLVNISSEAGSIGACRRKAEFDYCMSKAALNMQSKILQNYLRDFGVKVLALHPGWMRTAMGGPDADLAPEEAADAIYNLAAAPPPLDGPIYLDYLGREMPW
ncbi:MAG: SDR family NAD(P)-dependent oxidoreductase [Patescibacteria group bacterium]